MLDGGAYHLEDLGPPTTAAAAAAVGAPTSGWLLPSVFFFFFFFFLFLLPPTGRSKDITVEVVEESFGELLIP
jgi:hypothetical protein